jgi:hypothetical protein
VGARCHYLRSSGRELFVIGWGTGNRTSLRRWAAVDGGEPNMDLPAHDRAAIFQVGRWMTVWVHTPTGWLGSSPCREGAAQPFFAAEVSVGAGVTHARFEPVAWHPCLWRLEGRPFNGAKGACWLPCVRVPVWGVG